MSHPTPEQLNHVCGQRMLGYINGRTLELALQSVSLPHGFKSFAKTQWVQVCPICHEAVLRSSLHSWPYRCGEGVMRTVDDFDEQSGVYTTEVLDFASFPHSRNALSSAIGQQKRDSNTVDTEARGKTLLRAIKAGHANPADFFSFSEAVHQWGRGERVWGNLKRFNGDALEGLMAAWLSEAPNLDIADAVEVGITIKGLDVSFASKHLRMLEPERFCVLDEVLSLGLGYALNPRGYKLFVNQLRAYQLEHRPDETIAYVEAGFFLLVRQGVRAVR
ncbi:hypothetical protein PQR70_37220 [Paraburkholderia madseniana]|jgi:hypothetical protein|uniref:hypothetical protein n=1 Tax=Paraburkholderia madseniana TaxID=2599607 RepID=UPI0038B7B1FE